MKKNSTVGISPRISAVVVLTIISSVLFMIRVLITGRYTFLYLFWNLFLAWIPLVISMLMIRRSKLMFEKPYLFAIVAVTWLLFFPNAPYLLTDFVHLKSRPQIPMWFDALLIGSFAWTGLQIGFYSLVHIHQILNRFMNQRITWLWIAALSYLTGLGLYLGRVLRWNSWDVLIDPLGIVKDAIVPMLNPFQHTTTHVFTLAFSAGIFFSYWVFIKLHKLSTHPAKH